MGILLRRVSRDQAVECIAVVRRDPPNPCPLVPVLALCALVCVQRVADGKFKTTTLCSVCFSPIVMPPTKREGVADPPPLR